MSARNSALQRPRPAPSLFGPPAGEAPPDSAAVPVAEGSAPAAQVAAAAPAAGQRPAAKTPPAQGREAGASPRPATRRSEPKKRMSGERFKTSVELDKQTLAIIDRLQRRYRLENARHYPLWQLLADAVHALDERGSKAS